MICREIILHFSHLFKGFPALPANPRAGLSAFQPFTSTLAAFCRKEAGTAEPNSAMTASMLLT